MSMGGVPMVKEDKEWILREFKKHIAEIKLDVNKDITKAIKDLRDDLPCEKYMQENHERDLEVQRIKQRMDNGERFEDKLARITDTLSTKQGLNIRRWQLIVATIGIAIILIPNILDIIQFLMKLSSWGGSQWLSDRPQ